MRSEIVEMDDGSKAEKIVMDGGKTVIYRPVAGNGEEGPPPTPPPPKKNAKKKEDV